MRIAARGLAKRFGRVEALRGLSFSIAAGERVALLGPNGSGKSTLTRIVMGLLSFEGELAIDGASPFRARVEIARRMAYVPQIAPRLSVPVRQLLRAIAGVREVARDDLERAARPLELDLADLAPRPFASLSGGTRQKLLIALALAARASLLILDEPSGSLDARARERLFEAIEGLPDYVTVLLCSHRLEEAGRLVGRVLALGDGRLTWDGPVADFPGAAPEARAGKPPGADGGGRG